MQDESNECFVLTLRKGKKRSGKTPSKVYFSDESKKYIQDYLKSREIHGEKFDSNSPLFITLDGDRLSVRQIQQMLKKYSYFLPRLYSKIKIGTSHNAIAIQTCITLFEYSSSSTLAYRPYSLRP